MREKEEKLFARALRPVKWWPSMAGEELRSGPDSKRQPIHDVQHSSFIFLIILYIINKNSLTMRDIVSSRDKRFQFPFFF
jgi:hypothetical protein